MRDLLQDATHSHQPLLPPHPFFLSFSRLLPAKVLLLEEPDRYKPNGSGKLKQTSDYLRQVENAAKRYAEGLKVRLSQTLRDA